MRYLVLTFILIAWGFFALCLFDIINSSTKVAHEGAMTHLHHFVEVYLVNQGIFNTNEDIEWKPILKIGKVYVITFSIIDEHGNALPPRRVFLNIDDRKVNIELDTNK